MADVHANLESVVTPDGARSRGERVGSTKHNSASLDGVKTLPDHADNRTGHHVLDEAREEGLRGEVRVVLLEVLLGRSVELEGNELEASLLESADDLADEASLDAIRPGRPKSISHVDILKTEKVRLWYNISNENDTERKASSYR